MGDSSEQLGLFPERSDQRAATLHRSQSGTGVLLQMGEIFGAEVRHRVRFQIGPDVFHWIEFGSDAGRYSNAIAPR